MIFLKVLICFIFSFYVKYGLTHSKIYNFIKCVNLMIIFYKNL